MSRNRETMKTPSLAGHFDAPDGYTGCFGWLCGYSADALFLDDAAMRFTRLTSSQRAHQGRVVLAVMLDPGNPPFSILDAPGVAHLMLKANVKKPFRLLHAKVALLGFQHQENRKQWRLRLLVSTGNWTRQTLEESLDLVWRIDIASESLSDGDAVPKQDCADIKAAWELLKWIQQRFDNRLLNATANGRFSETMNAVQRVKQWINACSENEEGEPRIFDNRRKSLLEQLPDKINVGGATRRNYLAMGSGFYETPADDGKPPEVPSAIIETLQKKRLLSMQQPQVELYINPMACQAIASAVTPLQESGVMIRQAATPPIVFGESAQRSLHAKFLFGANRRSNSNFCSSAWIYLGSGNLTRQGFSRKMSARTGNLEAGVVFFPRDLYWKKNKSVQESQVVTNLLPLREDDVSVDVTQLSAGSGMEQRDATFTAPPVAWLLWCETDIAHELRTYEPCVIDFQVMNFAEVPCKKTETGFQWREDQPRQIRICWQANGQSLEAQIPVVDQYGRIAATGLSPIDIAEAWWQLAEFPLPPHDDEGDSKDEGSNSNERKDQSKGSSVSAGNYPIRQMMDLLESIAAKQTEIDVMDWGLWCNSLQQILGQARNSSPVAYFRDKLKMNPLSPLRHHSFRPLFAETCSSESGKLYDETLVQIEKSWKVNGLSQMGG